MFKAPARASTFYSRSEGVGRTSSTSSASKAVVDNGVIAESAATASASLERLLKQNERPATTGDSGRGSLNLLAPRISSFPGGEVVMVFDSPDAMAPQQPSEQQQQQPSQQQQQEQQHGTSDGGNAAKEKCRRSLKYSSSSNQSLSTIASSPLASSPVNRPADGATLSR